ncbi:MAG: DUF4838 domain-containing protein [Armatimonadetes bacterium]|nr:DUF4838 domain-containing protein [Armatimonadota bacterium]
MRLLGLLMLAALPVSAADLVLADHGQSEAVIVVSADAGTWEKRAADDLRRCVQLMTGAALPLVATPAAGPCLLIGRAALADDPTLRAALDRVAKRKPVARADAIALRRRGNRVLLAGNNDESHYYAVSALLQQWGCRWYLPTEFGECVPEVARLVVGDLDRAYAPPFEIRHYWLSWNADATGADEFRRRNFMTETSLPGMGHALGQYTARLVPPGKTLFNVPLSEDATADEVAARIDADYARGVAGISLAIEDGDYTSDSARDRQLQAGLRDKYTLQPSNTDAMLTLYNAVARRLRAKYPNSPTRLGGMAYANVTIPPQQVSTIEPNLVMWLAPIDIDPNHGIDDPNSPPRQEYGAMLDRWAKVTDGRLVIYDYDQGQLVWRDLPNPSHHAFASDVRHYRQAGILGVGTESRGASATTFLNLFFRGQLMWDPDAKVADLLAEFYPKFYGPAAAPMAEYWNTIYAAWEQTLVTEHEVFAAPAIYTPELLKTLRTRLGEAQSLVAPLRSKPNPSRLERQYVERLRFTELSFEVIDSYLAMVRAAATDADYATAAAAGARGLAAREALTDTNVTFTTYRKIGEAGTAWWPGEVQQMRDLLARTNGTKGTLVARLPLTWSFRRDPHDTGLARGWAYQEADLGDWRARGEKLSLDDRRLFADGWEPLRADLYLQAQGIRHADRQSYTGHYWYQTPLELTAAQAAGPVHMLFPGLFNEAWLYVNGTLVAHRTYSEPWWRNDYAFEWDVDLAGRLRAGRNLVTVRGYCPHHFGGMFRRPVLWRP